MRIDELRDNMNDNARHFVDLPEVIFFDELSDHLEELPGYQLNEFEVDGVVGLWIEFEWANNKFFVDNQPGDYRFYVEDPKCEEGILLEISNHLRSLLEKKAMDGTL